MTTLKACVIGLLAAAVIVSSSSAAQTKAPTAAQLKRQLQRFPEADANRDGILTEQEAREYRSGRQKGKAAKPSEGQAEAARQSDVAYGPHERQRLDLWRAKSDKPTPVFIFFHGGSFKAGDKSIVTGRPIFQECLEAGISVVSANYRFSSDAPYPAPMLDGARAVQFVRSRAQEWNLDPQRIAVSGSSAGATLALWIALHDDLAVAGSDDTIARFSTRVTCASPHSGTAGLAAAYFQRHAGVARQGAALWQLFGAASQAEFDSPAKQALAREASPLTHATADDPPLFLTYQGAAAEAPFAPDAAQSNWIHHVCLGLPLKARFDELGKECVLHDTARPPTAGEEIAFLKKHLFAASGTAPGK